MKYLLLALAVALAGCSDTNAADEAKKGDPMFLQMSSMTDQVRSAEDILPGRIFTEIVDGEQGIGVGDGTGAVMPEDGVYTVMLAPQSGKAAGCGRYWIAVNGEAVANSSVQICQSCPTLTSVAVSQVTMSLLAGDVVTFWQSGKLGIQATIPDELDEPAVPSVIVTIFKL